MRGLALIMKINCAHGQLMNGQRERERSACPLCMSLSAISESESMIMTNYVVTILCFESGDITVVCLFEIIFVHKTSNS